MLKTVTVFFFKVLNCTLKGHGVIHVYYVELLF